MPSRQSPPPLSAGDLAGLELLRADRDSDDPQAVSAAALQAAIGTRFLDSWLNRVRAHGYVIGIDSEGRYEIGHHEPDVERSERKPEVVIQRLDNALARLRAAKDGEDAQLTIDVGPVAPRSWAEAA